MIQSESAINALLKKIENLEQVINKDSFNIWQKATSSTLQNIYPNNEDVKKKFEGISAIHRTYSSINDVTHKAKIEAKEYLESIINDIQTFGLPHLSIPVKDDKINVVVTQQNNQNQTTTVSVNIDFIIDVLKGELRASEIEEIKEILESNDEPKEKKKNFIEKIKSFGNDVASNILANILTNPAIYSALEQL